MRMQTIGALLLGSLLSSACEDAPYSGSLGSPVPADFSRDVPIVSGRVGTSGPKRLVVDTGSPFALVMDKDQIGFLGVPPPLGPILFARTMDLEIFGVTFHHVPVVVMDILDGDVGFDGVVGLPLIDPYVLTLDAKNRTAALSQMSDAIPMPPGEPLEAGFVLQAQRDNQRVIVGVRVENHSGTEKMILDTGASVTAMGTQFMSGLTQDGRPRCCESTGFVAGGTDVNYATRLAALDFLGAPGPLRIQSVAVRTGGNTHNTDNAVESAVGYLGGNVLEQFVVVLSPSAQQLVLFRYQLPTHLDPTPFVDTGAVLARGDDGTWHVAEVYPNTPAAAAGLREKDEVIALNERALQGISVQEEFGYFNQFAVGDVVIYHIRRDGQDLDVSAAVVDLLPEMSL